MAQARRMAWFDVVSKPCKAAWQPYGAPSWKDSLTPCGQPARQPTYSIAPGWSKSLGWKFNGVENAGLVTTVGPPTNDQTWSLVVLYRNLIASPGAFGFLAGIRQYTGSYEWLFGFQTNWGSSTIQYWGHGSMGSYSLSQSAGVVSVSGVFCYANGTPMYGPLLPPADSFVPSDKIRIGFDGSSRPINADILAVGIWDEPLSDADNAALYRALRAIDELDYWLPPREWWFFPGDHFRNWRHGGAKVAGSPVIGTQGRQL